MFGFAGSDDNDALELLRADHKAVDDLFKEFDAATDDRNAPMKLELVGRICDALSVHARIEEELFYPALRRASADAADLLNEAAVEHQSLMDIIGRLRKAPTSDPLYDAGVRVLGEYVKHHVREEENDIFPLARDANLDLDRMGKRLQARKDELTRAGPARGRASGAVQKRATPAARSRT